MDSSISAFLGLPSLLILATFPIAAANFLLSIGFPCQRKCSAHIFQWSPCSMNPFSRRICTRYANWVWLPFQLIFSVSVFPVYRPSWVLSSVFSVSFLWCACDGLAESSWFSGPWRYSISQFRNSMKVLCTSMSWISFAACFWAALIMLILFFGFSPTLL